MHHPFLDLEFRDSPDFFLQNFDCSTENFEYSLGFYLRATAAADRQTLHGESTTLAGAFEAGLQRRDAPEAKTNPFFKILAKHRIIFTKFRDTPNPKVKRCELFFVKEASPSNHYHSTIPHTPTKKYGYGDGFKKKEVNIFWSNSKN